MKVIIYAAVVTFAFALFTSNLLAQTKLNDTVQVKQEVVVKTVPNSNGPKFIDENKDGVCDRFAQKTSNENGPNFIDADKDGVCDNRGTNGCKTKNGKGYQHRNGQKNGQCCGRGPCGGKGGKNK